MKILIGSPIHQNSLILKEFLQSLKEVEKDGFEVHYYFVDDNDEDESKRMLNEFHENVPFVNIIASNNNDNYIKDEVTHRWTENLIDKVARFKNDMIDFAKENNFDYLFLIDSDIVLHPRTLKQLVSNNKEIVAEIFWTRWQPNSKEMPQVWVKDSYTFYDAKENIKLPDEVIRMQTDNFLGKLKMPGVYKVGGLGACTLISKKAIDKGVNFSNIYNVSFWGEDRAFCIRAAAIGIELFVDTHYPAYHIYRLNDVDGVKSYKDRIKIEEEKVRRIKIINILKDIVPAIENYPKKEEDSWKKYFELNQLEKIEELINSKNRSFNYGDERNSLISKIHIDNVNEDYCSIELSVGSTGYCNNENYKYDEDLIVEFDLRDISPKITRYEKKNIIEEKQIIRIAKNIDNKLALSMVVKNEEGRYLERALLKHREYIDKAIFIDDGSTDKTIDIIKDCLQGIDVKIINNSVSKFNNEINLRKQQWEESNNIGADWLLILDADEIFEDKFKDGVKDLINNRDIDAYSFRLYDFWNETQYREDSLWKAHLYYKCFLVRPQRNFLYQWVNTPQHCGRVPANIYQLPNAISNFRLKHMGWAKEEDRVNKYNRYMLLDGEGKYGDKAQYESILDNNPNLILWKE